MIYKKKEDNKMKKEKPNKIKIEMAFDSCKTAILELLNGYNSRIDDYCLKIKELKSKNLMPEVERYNNKLKLILSKQAKMLNLMDQVEQFGFMIDEAFAKNTVYSTFGSVLAETNKINMAPEVKKIVKSMNSFEKKFKRDCVKFNSIFNKISKSVTDIDNSLYANDSELDNFVNSRFKEYDEYTTKEAEILKNNNL